MKKILFLGTMFLSFVSNSQTIKDIDGNSYNTVVIGQQIWLKENLVVSRFNNGDSVSKVSDNTKWANSLNAYRSSYENKSDNQLIYGALYNWNVVVDSRNVCPVGFKVPKTSDWSELFKYLGDDTNLGSKLKEEGNLHWNASQNIASTNSSQFTALPSGYRGDGGAFGALKTDAYFWTKEEYNTTEANAINLSNASNAITKGHYNKKNGFAIRCVRESKLALNEKVDSFLQISPNPSKLFTISNIPTQLAKFQVYSVEGKVCKEFSVIGSSTTLDLSDFKPGTYFIHLQVDGSEYVNRISVE